MELLLEVVFSMDPLRGYITRVIEVVTPRGGGFEYLHRSAASRKRRRKGNPVPGYNWVALFLVAYKYGDLAVQVGGVSNLEQ
jgi:hypothetical protein